MTETVLEKIIKEKNIARKKCGLTAAFLSFVQSEIEKIGKNNGNRITTDDEAIRVIQKIIETNKNTFETTKDEKLKNEIAVLEKFLPEMVDDSVLSDFIRNKVISASNANLGVIMKSVKEEFGSLVDMKKTKIFVEEILRNG